MTASFSAKAGGKRNHARVSDVMSEAASYEPLDARVAAAALTSFPRRGRRR